MRYPSAYVRHALRISYVVCKQRGATAKQSNLALCCNTATHLHDTLALSHCHSCTQASGSFPGGTPCPRVGSRVLSLVFIVFQS